MSLSQKTVKKQLIRIKNPTEGNIYSFAYGLRFYKLVWIFFIGCIIGYVVETMWCYIVSGHFENRQGLIYGPFIPVYGFGGVVLTLALYRIRHLNGLAVFGISAVVGAAFEYLCSWFQEIAFGTVSWEYSDSPLNLNGRTNLQYAIFWGLLGMIFIKNTYPFLSRQIEKIPNKIGIVLTWVMVVFMTLNMLVSALAVRRWTNRVQGAPPANIVSEVLDTLYPDERLEKIYIHMQVVE